MHQPLVPRACLMTASIILVSAALAAAVQHEHGTHQHPQAEKLNNPVAANPASVAAGRKLYSRYCAECHGATGKGDGAMAEDLDLRPADFTDATWRHGSSDGEIFVVIRDGTRDGMKTFGGKLTATEIWHVVNYLRTLGPTAAKQPG